MLANEDILRKEAAKKYWTVREYDPIVGQLYDEEKEKQFVTDRDQKAAVHGKDQVKKLPAIVQQNGLMYNPINNEVEDE